MSSAPSPAPPSRPDGNEAGILQDRELARLPGLPGGNHLDEVADRPFAAAELFDETPPGGVGQDLECVRHRDTLLVRHMFCQ